MLFALAIVLLSMNFVMPRESCEEGDVCTTSDGSHGVVTNARVCKVYKAKIHLLRSNHCGFSENGSLVCCPSKVKPARDRPAVEKCKSFGNKPEDDDDLLGVGVDRIFNGTNSEVGEFPHFAQLGYQVNDEMKFECGGALISSQFVLTAAHCVLKTRNPKIVRLGKTSAILDNKADSNIHKDVNVEKVIRHPLYVSDPKYHDIALVKLARPVVFTAYIFPACLYPKNDFVDMDLTIAGFGRNDAIDSLKKPDWLQKAIVQEVPLTDCRSQFRKAYQQRSIPGLTTDRGVTDDLICASDSLNNANTCKGDSGSGLQLVANETYFVVGVTSFGVACSGKLPSFYTRVYSYLDWIEENVWN